MSDFNVAVEFVLSHEGGYVDNVYDRGGTTNFGISLRFLKNLSHESLKRVGIFEDPNEDTIKNLTIDQAKAIYRGEFWEQAPFEKISNQEYCNYIFDMAVNIGLAPAIKCVQRACWAVQRDWGHLKDDGILGLQTLAAIRVCGVFIMPALRAERANHYRLIINNHPEQKEFFNGWLNRTYGK
jgi:lysozyme family protein